jgi:hypothetical protein
MMKDTLTLTIAALVPYALLIGVEVERSRGSG